jgi:hypothetical protein
MLRLFDLLVKSFIEKLCCPFDKDSRMARRIHIIFKAN